MWVRRAAGVLQGRHDFAAFSANPKRLVESTVRDLRKLEVRKHGSEITILAEGNGFLYKMVRSLAGFLVKAGQQTITSREIRETIVSRVRTAKVKTAPPRGLFLWEVFYR